MQPETICYLSSHLAAACNVHTSTTDLERLSQHKDHYVRYEVAKNRSTQDYTLEGLSHDEKRFIRMAVVGHPHTPLDVLRRMSENDEDTYVRCDADYFYKKRISKLKVKLLEVHKPK